MTYILLLLSVCFDSASDSGCCRIRLAHGFRCYARSRSFQPALQSRSFFALTESRFVDLLRQNMHRLSRFDCEASSYCVSVRYYLLVVMHVTCASIEGPHVRTPLLRDRLRETTSLVHGVYKVFGQCLQAVKQLEPGSNSEPDLVFTPLIRQWTHAFAQTSSCLSQAAQATALVQGQISI